MWPLNSEGQCLLLLTALLKSSSVEIVPRSKQAHLACLHGNTGSYFPSATYDVVISVKCTHTKLTGTLRGQRVPISH